MNNFMVMTIQKVNHLTCNDYVIELPLFKLETETICRWHANSLYVLQLDSGLEWKHVEFHPDILEKINKYWDICMSLNLSYMNLQYES